MSCKYTRSRAIKRSKSWWCLFEMTAESTRAISMCELRQDPSCLDFHVNREGNEKCVCVCINRMQYSQGTDRTRNEVEMKVHFQVSCTLCLFSLVCRYQLCCACHYFGYFRCAGYSSGVTSSVGHTRRSLCVVPVVFAQGRINLN